jgi:hypothetical protein
MFITIIKLPCPLEFTIALLPAPRSWHEELFLPDI